MRVYAREGIAGGGHGQVAEEAQVSVPTVFVYFPTREVLTETVLAEVGRFILEDVLRPASQLPGPSNEVLVGMAMAFADVVDTNPEYARVWLNWSTAFHDERWPMYAEFQDDVLAMVMPVVERGKADGELAAELDTEDAAQLLVGSAHMLLQMKFTGQSRTRVERFLNSLVDGYVARN